MSRLNLKQATRILDDHVSSHEGHGNWMVGGDGSYWADFNIKVYLPYLDLSDEQANYVNTVFYDVLQWELEYLIDQIKADKSNPLGIQQTGRFGGWLSVKWYEPETALMTINLAYAVRRIDQMIREAVAYVSSKEFWQAELAANCPKADEIEIIVDDEGTVKTAYPIKES